VKYQIRRLDIWSLAKFMAVWGLIVGFIIGLIMAALFMFMGQWMFYGTSFASAYGLPIDLTSFGAAAAGVMIIVYPIFLAIVGLIGGIITGAIYNLVAAFAGGIQVELTEGTVSVPESKARKTSKK